MTVNKRSPANGAGENYLHGRKAGVEGTYGTSHGSVAERTASPGAGSSDGGGSESVSSVASSIYQKARRNGGSGDGEGDQALTSR